MQSRQISFGGARELLHYHLEKQVQRSEVNWQISLEDLHKMRNSDQVHTWFNQFVAELRTQFDQVLLIGAPDEQIQYWYGFSRILNNIQESLLLTDEATETFHLRLRDVIDLIQKWTINPQAMAETLDESFTALEELDTEHDN